MEGKLSKKSYTREFKIKVSAGYKTSSMCKKHGLNSKTVSSWVSSGERFQKSSKGFKCMVNSEYTDVEVQLMEKKIRELGKNNLKSQSILVGKQPTDREPSVKPLLILKGNGARIPMTEKVL